MILRSVLNKVIVPDSLYKIFPFNLINGIFPVSLQFWRVREEIRSCWQTSWLVRNFSPFRCGVRFCRACLMVTDSSSKAAKNEPICGDLLSSISFREAVKRTGRNGQERAWHCVLVPSAKIGTDCDGCFPRTMPQPLLPDPAFTLLLHMESTFSSLSVSPLPAKP